jgi:hypothetical protein
MSGCTTLARSLIKTVALLAPIALAAAPALAASGPFQALYIFPGVTDNGGTNFTGIGTAVHCFSFSPVQETIQYVVRNNVGTIAINTTENINSFGTITAVTHPITIYGGFERISATSTNIVCTAQVLDASASVPNGIELHGTRFNPISGSQE